MTWLSASAAADYLGVSVRTLTRYEASGRLHPQRTPGGHRRYRQRDLDKLLST